MIVINREILKIPEIFLKSFNVLRKPFLYYLILTVLYDFYLKKKLSPKQIH